MLQLKKRVVNPNETPTWDYEWYVMLSLAASGGSATYEEVKERTEFLMRNRLHEEDYVNVHWETDGKRKRTEYAPVGMTEDVWPVWAGRVHIILMHMRLGDVGRYKNTRLAMYSQGVYTLTPAGVQMFVMLATKYLMK